MVPKEYKDYLFYVKMIIAGKPVDREALFTGAHNLDKIPGDISDDLHREMMDVVAAATLENKVLMGEEPSKVYGSKASRKVGMAILNKVIEKYQKDLEKVEIDSEKAEIERWKPTLKRYNIPIDTIFNEKE